MLVRLNVPFSDFLKQPRSCFHRKVSSLITVAWHKKQWDRHQISSHHHLPPSHTHCRDGGFLSLTSKALLPEILFHSSHICQFACFCKTSLLPFNPCHVLNPFTSFFHPRNTSIAPQHSSHRVGTPLTVSSTLSGLAGEKTQAAGGGLALPENPATLLSHWHQGSAVECAYTLLGGRCGGGAGAALGVNMALTIWRTWSHLSSPGK